MRTFNLITLDEAISRELSQLTAAEKKVIYCFLLHCKSNNLKVGADPIKINAVDYAALLGESSSSAQKYILNALDVLFERDFTYEVRGTQNQKTSLVVTRWIGTFVYGDTPEDLSVSVYFTPSVYSFLNDAVSKVNRIGPDLLSLPKETKELL